MQQTRSQPLPVPPDDAAPQALPGPWYKDAIIYQLHVRSFFDTDGNGIGDFNGLIAKLDYLRDLGVTALWLLPFYPSPLKDDGYDIADYYGVNPVYGKLEDFQRFVAEAHARGLKVITELVINHTSDQHAWFQRARRAPKGSPERDFYVWSDDDQKYSGTRIIFTDTEKSNWSWDEEAKQFYWHRFFWHQPDLNFDNPAVVEEVLRAMRFWLDMGVDGLRLDAVPYLCEREGTSNENLPETHAVIKKIRAMIDAEYKNVLLLAEANMWPEDVQQYFGEGDECHMAFHFPLMPRLYMALAQADRNPIVDILNQTPDIPDNCQWATFLRNHDELTLEMVTTKERSYLWDFYAADKRARINVGIRRRLAPLMENDRHRIELMFALLLSMPGTPVLYYGDEIGMGDNIDLGDRDGVRTPMQWSDGVNGGFSTSPLADIKLPPVNDPVYGFEAVNVDAQAQVKSSLLNWTRRLLGAARDTHAFNRGTLTFLRPSNRKILAYVRTLGEDVILCVANLAATAQPVSLNLSEYAAWVPVEMLGNTSFPAIDGDPYTLSLAPYGFFWFRLTKPDASDKISNVAFLPEWRTLVLSQRWKSFRDTRTRYILEKLILPDYLLSRSWYAAPDSGRPQISIRHALPLGDARLVVAEVTAPDGTMTRHAAMLGLAWDTPEADVFAQHTADILTRVRQAAQIGVLYDILHDHEALARALGELGSPQDDATDDQPMTFELRLPETFRDALLDRLQSYRTGPNETGTPATVLPLPDEECRSCADLGNGLRFRLLRELAPEAYTDEGVGQLLLHMPEGTFVAGLFHSLPPATP